MSGQPVAVVMSSYLMPCAKPYACPHLRCPSTLSVHCLRVQGDHLNDWRGCSTTVLQLLACPSVGIATHPPLPCCPPACVLVQELEKQLVQSADERKRMVQKLDRAQQEASAIQDQASAGVGCWLAQ